MNDEKIIERLEDGLGDKISNFEIYSDGLWTLDFYNNKPAYYNKCCCGHKIDFNYYVRHLETGEVKIVGSSCITRFRREIKCTYCGNMHKGKKKMIKFCQDCTKIHCKHCEKLCQKRECDDCLIQMGKRKACPLCGNINRCQSMYCKECRVFCNICKTYHESNDVCVKCSYCHTTIPSTEYYEHKERCKNTIRFGRYKGRHFDEIPKDYIRWAMIKAKENDGYNHFDRLYEYFKNKTI